MSFKARCTALSNTSIIQKHASIEEVLVVSTFSYRSQHTRNSSSHFLSFDCIFMSYMKIGRHD